MYQYFPYVANIAVAAESAAVRKSTSRRRSRDAGRLAEKKADSCRLKGSSASEGKLELREVTMRRMRIVAIVEQMPCFPARNLAELAIDVLRP